MAESAAAFLNKLTGARISSPEEVLHSEEKEEVLHSEEKEENDDDEGSLASFFNSDHLSDDVSDQDVLNGGAHEPRDA